MLARQRRKYKLPVIPLKDLVVYPFMILHFDIGRESSLQALEYAMANGQFIMLTVQKLGHEEFGADDIYHMGTLCKIKQLLKVSGDNVRVLVEGIERARILEFIEQEPFMLVQIQTLPQVRNDADSVKEEAIVRNLKSLFDQFFSLNPRYSRDAFESITGISDGGQLADIIATNFVTKVDDRQLILEQLDVHERLILLICILNRELEIIRTDRDIQDKVRTQVDKHQRDYYLREQIKVIRDELGEGEDFKTELTEYRQKIEQLELSDEIVQKLSKDCLRLEKMHSHNPDYSTIATYLDTVLSLPWNVKTPENSSIKNAEKILNNEHYGLEKVKEHIIEHLAVRQLSSKKNPQILCLVGPPGVGKTSIARSIANATGRNYHRISLGGVHDEAEVRGHRRTYVGAMPGKIINALRIAGSCNALILLDEIDKMGRDHRGDPAAALLEILDCEQNYAFRDNYLDIPFDLSDILFVCTANTTDSISKPLLDRMDTISITSYTTAEKKSIASKYLLPKQLEKHGLIKDQVKISPSIMEKIIEQYTREAGVRGLERCLADICRKCVKEIVAKTSDMFNVNDTMLLDFLGPARFKRDKKAKKPQIGVATGLAWTAVGGETLMVEVNVMSGTGKLELTGSLGDVMKESAKAALSYTRSQAAKLGLNTDFYKDVDMHIHFPEGATPKDGPSAGVTITTALISALTGRSVDRDMAMTGEITLRGRVLPVGGIKEKTLAAYRWGITTVFIPYDNKPDLETLPDTVKNKMKFICVSDVNEILDKVLSPNVTQLPLALDTAKAYNVIEASDGIPVYPHV